MKIKELINYIKDRPEDEVVFLLDGTEIYSKFVAVDPIKDTTLFIFDFVEEDEYDSVVI